MHVVQYSATCAVAVLAMIAGFGCASGVSVMDQSGDAGDEQGTAPDSSWVPSYDSAAMDSGTGPVYDAQQLTDDGADSPSSVSDSGQDSSAGGDTSVGSNDGGGFDGNGFDTGSGSGSGDAEAGPPPMGLSVLYLVEQSSAMSAYIGCQLSVSNSGSTTVPISSLEARYYFIGTDTAGVAVTPQMTINWSHVSTTGANVDLTVTSTFNPVQPAATMADTYIAFDFSSSHSMLAPGESAVFSWRVQGPDPAHDVYNQTSDYSFNASLTSLAPWTHVTLVESGSLAWGTPP